jgi:hypothetical protein
MLKINSFFFLVDSYLNNILFSIKILRLLILNTFLSLGKDVTKIWEENECVCVCVCVRFSPLVSGWALNNINIFKKRRSDI